MKLYRCPHCGEKAFTTSDHIYIGLVSMVSTSRYATNSKCSRCNNKVQAAWHYGRVLWIIFGILAIYCIFQAVSFLAFSYVRQALHWGVAVACGIYAVAFVITAVIVALKKPLVRYNPNEWGMEKYSMPLPNTRIKVNSDNYLKPYRVYGLKFKFDNGDGSVKEVFKDGMVPMARERITYRLLLLLWVLEPQLVSIQASSTVTLTNGQSCFFSICKRAIQCRGLVIK